ncbi:hypothetical protein TFLX_03106 [Thermoflexales bacterium]|nr:hypothetical protein TFLX_03106 [Thermoflexales bacterium]
MNAIIDELFELGSEVIDRQIDDAAEAKAERLAKENAEIQRKLDLIVAATGVDAETLVNVFGMRYLSDRYDHQFVIDYLGRRASVGVVKQRGYGATGENVEFDHDYRAATVRESIAKFVNKVKREYVASKQEILATLSGAEELLRFSQFSSKAEWKDAEVRTAAHKHLLKFVPGNDADDHDINTWLNNTAMVDGSQEMVDMCITLNACLEYRRNKQRLLNYIRMREDPRNGRDLDRLERDEEYYSSPPLTRESIDVLWSAARDEGLADDVDVIVAMAHSEGELRDFLHEQERSKQRAEIESSSFRPFRYYEVRYSLIGESDSGEEREVDWDFVIVLHEQPDADGYFHSVSGSVIKPRNVVAVLRHDVLNVEQLRALNWSRKFTEPTDFGEIRVTPDGAELI